MGPTTQTQIQPPPGVEPWRHRAGRWFRRYAPAEVGAIVGALLAGWAANLAGITAVTVYAATLGECVAFYGVIIVRDLRHGGAAKGRPWWRFAGRIVFEFGPAEALDTLVVRPLAMYIAAHLVGDMLLGIVAGKLAADAVFYAVAIACHELGRSSARR